MALLLGCVGPRPLRARPFAAPPLFAYGVAGLILHPTNNNVISFAVFPDGWVFFKTDAPPSRDQYRVTQLSPPELRSLMASLSPEQLVGKEGHHVPIEGNDGSTQYVFVWKNGVRHALSVRNGFLLTAKFIASEASSDWAKSLRRSRAPLEPVMNAIDAAMAFADAHEHSAPLWIPATVVVELRPVARLAVAPGETQPWPAHWPAPAQGCGEQSLRLDGSLFDEAIRLVDHRTSRDFGSGVFRSDRCSFVASLVVPLPGQERWGPEWMQ